MTATVASGLIDEVRPGAAVAVEAFDDDVPAPLFPAEEAMMTRSVDKRRAEFATARRCARAALAELGYPPAPLLAGPRREPLWPDGIVGSITHCAGYRAAVVARAGDLAGLGIDAEPHEPLPDRLIDAVAAPADRDELDRLHRSHPEICWDRLLFSAKESVYKVWYPIAGRWLGFEDAEVVFDPVAATFTAKLLVPGPPFGAGTLTGLTGRYAIGRGLVLTAIFLPVPGDGGTGPRS